MPKIEFKSTTEVEVDMETLAQCFANMNDEDQAQFFIEVAKIAESWSAFRAESQWWYVGRHLATCRCSTDSARDMIRSLADAINLKQEQAA